VAEITQNNLVAIMILVEVKREVLEKDVPVPRGIEDWHSCMRRQLCIAVTLACLHRLHRLKLV